MIGSKGAGSAINPNDIDEFFTKTISQQIHLTAIDPENRNGTVARDFCQDAAAAMAWAIARNGEGRNIYYAINCIRDGLNKRADKSDITAIRFAHVDIDPPKGVASFTMAQKDAAFDLLVAAFPSVVIWSGNGWQALWRLPDGVSVAEVEEINRRLIAALGGDKGTHDASRLFRVPGLINWPNKQKVAYGREPTMACMVAEDDGLISKAEDMLATLPVVPEEVCRDRAAVALGDWVPHTANSLGLPSNDALRGLIDQPKGANRSADTFAFACEALRRDLTEEQIAGVLLNPCNAISAHCLDQHDPRRAVLRAIGAALSEDDVRLLSKKQRRDRERRMAAGEQDEPHDETRLWTLEAMLRECVFIEDGAQVADTTRSGHVLTQADFRASTAASKMKVTVGGKGGSDRTITKRVSEVWMEHVDRRSVATVTFRPGGGVITTAPGGQTALNSWGGFRFASPPVDWQTRADPFEAHVRWLFSDDADAFLDWLAHIAQRPGELPSFAFLHIARSHGMGRNWVASVLGRVFVGYAALAFDLGGTLRNGYNGVLAGKVLAIVDEIDEGNSQRKYQIQQELKQLITEETRTINPKYVRQHRECNCCRMLIFSNSPAALPLEDDDRRIYVVECEDQPKEPDYYAALYGLRDDTMFIASVAQLLTQRDISRFAPGQRPPVTPAKAALLDRCRSEAEHTLHSVVAAWPVDIITNEELHELMGEHCPKGAALRYALDRAGIVRVRDWKGTQSGFGTRPKVTAYALRNASTWKGVSLEAVRAELGRIDKAGKEAAFYGD